MTIFLTVHVSAYKVYHFMKCGLGVYALDPDTDPIIISQSTPSKDICEHTLVNIVAQTNDNAAVSTYSFLSTRDLPIQNFEVTKKVKGRTELGYGRATLADHLTNNSSKPSVTI